MKDEIVKILAIIDADTDKPIVPKVLQHPLAHKILESPSLVKQKEDAERWRRVKETHEFKFVRHIESHLGRGQVPICKICGKTIFEIAEEGNALTGEEG